MSVCDQVGLRAAYAAKNEYSKSKNKTHISNEDSKSKNKTYISNEPGSDGTKLLIENLSGNMRFHTILSLLLSCRSVDPGSQYWS